MYNLFLTELYNLKILQVIRFQGAKFNCIHLLYLEQETSIALIKKAEYGSLFRFLSSNSLSAREAAMNFFKSKVKDDLGRLKRREVIIPNLSDVTNELF